ncbi:family S53 protease [Mycena sanguinolenta]|nr:family S53 protease [Mycena sanguinolenta]
MFGTGYFIVFTLTFVSAKPLGHNLVVHERRDTVPAAFVDSGPAPPAQSLTLRLNLVQNDLPGLESALNAAADPKNPSYGKWLSKDEVESFARPSAETTAAVNQWLSANSIDSTPVSAAGDWISIAVPVSTASSLLNANFSVFTYTATGQQLIRTREYSIPASLQSHIKVIMPTTSFSIPHRAPPVSVKRVSEAPSSTRSAEDNTCTEMVTPSCLQSLYGIPATPATNKNNAIGVAGFNNQFANQADLTQFLQLTRPDIDSSTSFTLTSVDGGINPQNQEEAGGEADLDIEYTVGLATNIPVTFISVGNQTQDGADGGYMDIITALIAEDAPPQVLTTSYGFENETSLSQALTFAMCDSYMQLTARGVSILFASGDGGVDGAGGGNCAVGAPFVPTFPTCPYVTLVGATDPTFSTTENGAPYSSGGFSNYFPQQSWQADAVNAYITSIGTQYDGLYNKSGRAYPDISAAGNSCFIVEQGFTTEVSGTSCSSPIFASVIGLLNDELLNAGKPVLGYLNPWLYANPGAFNDVTTGNNPGCFTDGFSASTGWDPVTGLGTPDYAAMRTAAGLS